MLTAGPAPCDERTVFSTIVLLIGIGSTNRVPASIVRGVPADGVVELLGIVLGMAGDPAAVLRMAEEA